MCNHGRLYGQQTDDDGPDLIAPSQFLFASHYLLYWTAKPWKWWKVTTSPAVRKLGSHPWAASHWQSTCGVLMQEHHTHAAPDLQMTLSEPSVVE
jgi:hypothetical protein